MLMKCAFFKMIFASLLLYADAPEPQNLLNEIRRQTMGFENVAFDAVWIDSKKGQPSRWEEQKLSNDKLGRFHMVTRSGIYDPNGKKTQEDEAPSQTDRTFDGEKTATALFYPKMDRFGKVITTPQQQAYRAAQIHAGPFPADLLATYRNPLTFVALEVRAGLVESLREGREVLLTDADEQRGMYRLTLSRSKGHEIPGTARVVALLDPVKGWLPARVDLVDDRGHVVRRSSCEYGRQNNGFWVPTKGSMKHYGDRQLNETPLWEQDFAVNQIELNNPKFDETVFQIKLLADTAVSDIRDHTNYRVAKDQVLESPKRDTN